MSLFPLGLISQGGGAGGGAAFELISTQVLSSTATTVTFSSIPSTYKHLQIRMTTRFTQTSSATPILSFNGDTASTAYAIHRLFSDGSTVNSYGLASSNTAPMYMTPGSSEGTGVWDTRIMDILDYASTTKYKTARMLNGFVGSSNKLVVLWSGLWTKTNAISSVTISADITTFVIGSRFSLYGVKGS